MTIAPTEYEQGLIDGVRLRLEALQHIEAAEALVEGEFPLTLLFVKVRDTRFPGRVLGNYSSVWNDDGTPMFSSDPDARAQFVSEILQEQLEGLRLGTLPSPDEIGITWF
jgi:hypothetical protein